MTNKDKVYGLLGLATKSGKLIAGTDVVIENIEYKKAKIVVVAVDASDKTKKNIQFVCDKNNIECFIYGTIDELSHVTRKT